VIPADIYAEQQKAWPTFHPQSPEFAMETSKTLGMAAQGSSQNLPLYASLQTLVPRTKIDEIRGELGLSAQGSPKENKLLTEKVIEYYKANYAEERRTAPVGQIGVLDSYGVFDIPKAIGSKVIAPAATAAVQMGRDLLTDLRVLGEYIGVGDIPGDLQNAKEVFKYYVGPSKGAKK
jgi:hypothetical protein